MVQLLYHSPFNQGTNSLHQSTLSFFFINSKNRYNDLSLLQNTQFKKQLTFLFFSVGSLAIFTSIFSRCDWRSVLIAIVWLQMRPVSLSVMLG